MGPDVLVPVAGMITGVLMLGGIGYAAVRIFNGPVGQALARRIQGRSGSDPDLIAEVVDLRQHLDSIQQRLTDTEERLDFSERLLSQRAESADRGTD